MSETQGGMKSDQDAINALYGDPETLGKNYEPYIGSDLDKYRDIVGMNDADRRALGIDLAASFTDAEITTSEASALTATIVRYAINPADEETSRQWATETRRLLREQYGEADGDRRLATVKSFIAQRPALQALLAGSGVGNHPRLVAALVGNAHNMRIEARSNAGKK